MADRSLRVVITGSSASAVKAFEDTAVAADASSKAAGDSLDSLSSRTGGIFQKIGNQMSSFGVPLGESVSKIGEKFDEADTKGQKFGQVMSTVGGAVALGLVGAAAGALELADKMEEADNKIAAAAGISQAAAKAIGDAFLTTGGQTIFTGQEMAEAYASVAAQLGQLNGKALDAAQALTVETSAATLAEASGTSLSDATSALASVLVAFHQPISAAKTDINDLYNGAKLTGMGVSGLSSAITKFASGLGAAKPPLSETIGLIDDLTAHGESGRKAVSAVTTAITGLVVPTTAAAAAQKFLGISITDTATGKMLPMTTIIGELQKATAGMSDQQALATLKTLGLGSASLKLLDTIRAGPDALTKYIDAISKHGSAQDAAAKATANLKDEAKKLWAGLQDLGTIIGEKILPVVEKFVGGLVDVAKALISSKPLLIGLGVLLAGLVVWWVANTIAAMAFWTAATAGIVILVAAIAVGIAWIVTHWHEVWTDIKNVASDAWHWVYNNFFGPLVNFFTSLPGNIAHVWGDIVNALHVAWSTVANWVNSNVIQPIVNFFVGIVTGVAHVWSDVVNAIHTAWSTVANWVNSTLIQPVVGFFSAIPGTIAHVWSDVVNAIHTAWSTVANWVNSNVIQPMVNFFTGLPGNIAHVWSDVVNAIHNAWSVVANWVNTNVIQPIVNFFTSLPGKIVTALGDGAKVLYQWGKDIVEGIINGIKSVGSSIGSTIMGFVSSIPVVGGLLSHLAEGGLVTKPTIALVGEAGPEFVIPLSKLGGTSVLNPTSIQSLPGMMGAGGAPTSANTAAQPAPGGRTQQINVYATTNASAAQIATEVGWALKTAAV